MKSNKLSLFSLQATQSDAPFYKRLMEMQCREDILRQNKFINKKNIDAITPFSIKYKKRFNDNNLRIYYFVGFTVLFSLQFVYDYVFHQNQLLATIRQKLRPRFYSKTILQQRQYSFDVKNPKSKQLGEIFLKIDQSNVEINQQIMNKIAGGSKIYEGDCVTIKQFVDFFQDRQIDQLRRRIIDVFRNSLRYQILL